MTSHDDPMDEVLDESLRGRLRATSDAVERERARSRGELDAARLARAVSAAHGRERARAATRRRVAFAAAAASLSAAAAVAVYVDRAPAPAELAAAPRCAASRIAPSRGELVAGRRHELDARARLGVAEGGVARFEASSACDATIVLERGTIDVWAKDLAGGELRVRAGETTVTVHGTVFRVTRDGDLTSVAVDEGLVEVRSGRSEPAFVRPGRAVEVRGAGLSSRALGADERAAVHAIVAEPSEVVDVGRPSDPPRLAADLTTAADASAPSNAASERPVPPTASELLRSAESAYREGRVDDARRLFRAAGALRGVDAEAAWLRLGRLEQRAGRTAEAASVLAEHRRRFPRGRLSAESLYLESRARRSLGEASVANALEDRLLAEHPTTPQAARVRTLRVAAP